MENLSEKTELFLCNLLINELNKVMECINFASARLDLATSKEEEISTIILLSHYASKQIIQHRCMLNRNKIESNKNE